MTITLTREEAQQVLDALEYYSFGFEVESKLIETLRARLAQPEPEPIAYKVGDATVYIKPPIYNAPPQRVYCSCGDGIVVDDGALCGTCVSLKKMREWQGLTDEDKNQIAKEAYNKAELTAWELAQRVGEFTEAKLKEKNT